jgi:hypothetical protein
MSEESKPSEASEKNKTDEVSSAKTSPTTGATATASAAGNPVAEAMRGLAFASLALGAVMIGTSAITLSHGLRAAALGPLAPGVLALLTTVLLFPAASSVERAPDAEAEKPVVAALFRDIARYSSLTLALCAISFLIINFR